MIRYAVFVVGSSITRGVGWIPKAFIESSSTGPRLKWRATCSFSYRDSCWSQPFSQCRLDYESQFLTGQRTRRIILKFSNLLFYWLSLTQNAACDEKKTNRTYPDPRFTLTMIGTLYSIRLISWNNHSNEALTAKLINCSIKMIHPSLFFGRTRRYGRSRRCEGPKHSRRPISSRIRWALSFLPLLGKHATVTPHPCCFTQSLEAPPSAYSCWVAFGSRVTSSAKEPPNPKWSERKR